MSKTSILTQNYRFIKQTYISHARETRSNIAFKKIRVNNRDNLNYKKGKN